MLSVLLYQAMDCPPPSSSLCRERLQAHGAQLTQVDANYACGNWEHPSGARVDIDLGRAPLQPEHPGGGTVHDDPHAQPKEYPGWQFLELSIHIPLLGPHWYVVEIGTWLEALAMAYQDWAFLISEDVGIEGEGGYGPGALDRLRLLQCWEHCHIEQCASLTIPRMPRGKSLALWRYRRESDEGAKCYPQLHWPQALVIGRQDRAFSTLLWEDAQRPFACPQVDYLVLPRDQGYGLLPADELLIAARNPAQLDYGAAVAIEPSPDITGLFAHSRLCDHRDFRALDTHEWSDSRASD